MSGFWSGLFGGSSSTLNANIPKFGQVGGFASGLGEKNLAQGSQFFSSLLSGDPTKTSKVLSPQISAVQGQKNQQLKTTAEFGNRSGGNNAAAQTASDKSRASIKDMIASLLGESASSLMSSGSGLLGTGLSAYEMQDQADAQRMQNWQNSILGQGTSFGIGAAEGFGLGKIFKPSIPKG